MWSVSVALHVGVQVYKGTDWIWAGVGVGLMT